MIKYELIIRALLTLTVVTVPLVYIIKRYMSSMKRVLSTLSQLRKQSDTAEAEEIVDSEDTPVAIDQPLSPDTPQSELQDAISGEIHEITMDIEITIEESIQETFQSEQPENDTAETEMVVEEIVEEVIHEIEERARDENVVEVNENQENQSKEITQKEASAHTNETTADQQPLKEESLSSIQPEKLQQTLETIKYSALTHKERGKLDMYEKKLIEGLALQPENKDFLKLLSNHYFEQGNYVKALTLLKKLINDDPTNHKAIRQIGQIYREQGDLEAARLLIEKAISLKDDNPTYLISMVEIHYENKEIRDAIKIMEKLIKIRPTNIDYLLTLATLHEEISEPTKAMAYYMKTLEFDPLNDHAKTAIRRLNA